MQITFADGVSLAVYSFLGTADNVVALDEIIVQSARSVMEIQFDTAVTLADVMPYYTGAKDKCGTVTVTDIHDNTFVHLNYVIPVALALKTVGGAQRVVLQLAQRNVADVAIGSLSDSADAAAEYNLDLDFRLTCLELGI